MSDILIPPYETSCNIPSHAPVVSERRSAGRKCKILGGPALKDLDRLKRLVDPHCIGSEKIWVGHGPPGPPGSAGPAAAFASFLQSNK